MTDHPSSHSVLMIPGFSRGRVVALIAVLAGLNAFGPLSMDLYLPAFPQMAELFDTSPAMVQLTLTMNVIGLVIGQLVFGPLTDAHGRRRIVIATTLVAGLAAFAAAAAPSIAILAAVRLIQGMAGGAGIAIARAIAADLTKGVAAARLFSFFIALSMIAPVVGPLIGGGLLSVTGTWRAAFVFLGIISTLLALAIAAVVPETLPVKKRHGGGLRQTGRAFRDLVRDRTFVGCMITVAFGYGTLFAFLTAGSFVLQEQFGMSTMSYALMFSVNAIGLMLMGFLNARLVRRFAPRTLLIVSQSVCFIAGVTLVVIGLVAVGALVAVLALIFIVVSMRGLITPNATYLGVDMATHKGSASAILGASTFLGGVIIAPFVTLSPGNPLLSMAATIAISGLIALLASWLLIRRPASV